LNLWQARLGRTDGKDEDCVRADDVVGAFDKAGHFLETIFAKSAPSARFIWLEGSNYP